MHIRSVWPDHRRRMYNSNIISKIAEKLVGLKITFLFLNFKLVFQEEGLTDVHNLVEMDKKDVDLRLKQVLEELTLGCTKYVSISKGALTGPGTGKTKLDKERMKFCLRDIVSY